MKEQPSNPCEKVSFILTYDQLEAAYNIYREQFISCDFIRRSMERLEERIGLCNLPYETLRDDPSLLHEAYLQFLRLEDCNVAYNDTLEQVIDAIEQWLASGTLSPAKILSMPGNRSLTVAAVGTVADGSLGSAGVPVGFNVTTRYRAYAAVSSVSV